MTRGARTRRVLTVLGVSYFALWACAPTMSAPSPVPLPEGVRNEGGVGAVSTVWGVPDGALRNPTGVGAGVEAYLMKEAAPRLDIGMKAYGGVPSLVGADFFARVRFIETTGTVVGMTASVGFLHVGGSLDFAFSLSDRVWFYIRPGGGAQIASVRVPVGLTWVRDKKVVSLELVPAWPSYATDASFFGVASDETAFQISGGLSVGWRFGQPRAERLRVDEDGTPLPSMP